MALSLVPLRLQCLPHRTPVLASPFLSSTSTSWIRLSTPPASISVAAGSRRRFPAIAAAQFNWFRAIQTTWKISKNGIEAGTNLVPDSVPRPIARIGATVVALGIALFVLKSFLSTAFFVLAMMGLVYFAFIAFNSREASGVVGSSSSTEEETLEEARRIMEKYK